MASTMASTFALSRPSEKLGTHSTSVDITEENNGRSSAGATLTVWTSERTMSIKGRRLPACACGGGRTRPPEERSDEFWCALPWSEAALSDPNVEQKIFPHRA